MEKKSLIYLDEIHLPIIVKDVIKNVWLAIMAAIIVCIGVFVYSNSSHQSLYKNEATFVVSPRSNGAYVGFYSSMSTANEMAGVFQEVFSSDVLKRLIKEDLENPNLSFVISASVAKGTNILTVSAQADSPETAHIVMKSVLKNYRLVSGYLFGSVVLDVLKNPQISVTPINPFQTKKYMIMGSCMAVIMMVAVIALLSVFRPTVKTIACAKRQMEESPLGVLQEEKRRLRFFLKRSKKAPLITDTSTSFQYSESVLRLAHKIRYQMQKDGKKVLLVTSVAENEGKSTVSSNLALALGKHGYKVALVDMDLRKPAIHKIFKNVPSEDLLSCLKDGAPSTWDASRSLHIVSHTRAISGADKLLHSEDFEKMMNTLREKMDFIILDSSPYTATADAGMLLQHADCCVLVVRQDWASYHICHGVAEDIGEGKAEYLGYIFNHYLDDGTAQTVAGHYEKYGKYGYYGKTPNA